MRFCHLLIFFQKLTFYKNSLAQEYQQSVKHHAEILWGLIWIKSVVRPVFFFLMSWFSDFIFQKLRSEEEKNKKTN